MATLKQKIESLLFISTHPLTLKKIRELTESESTEAEKILDDLRKEYKEKNGGIEIIRNGHDYQMVTSPACSKLVEAYVRKEETGELTRPQLETLTVIVYRGPITKAELDQIRGVNSSLILRNLMIRGLTESFEDKKTGVISYAVTMDFLRFLGVREADELPDYERLNGHQAIGELLQQMKKDDAPRGTEKGI